MQACSVRELFDLVIEHGQSASMDGINATAAMLRLAKVGAAPFTHLLKQPLPPAFAPAEIVAVDTTACPCTFSVDAERLGGLWR